MICHAKITCQWLIRLQDKSQTDIYLKQDIFQTGHILDKRYPRHGHILDTDISQTGRIQDRAYHRQGKFQTGHILDRAYPRQGISQTGHILDRAYPKQDISQTGHILDRKYPRQDISQTGHFLDKCQIFAFIVRAEMHFFFLTEKLEVLLLFFDDIIEMLNLCVLNENIQNVVMFCLLSCLPLLINSEPSPKYR